MRYYLTADVHGYFTELKTALTEHGFFEDREPHKLIVCGHWHCSFGHSHYENDGGEFDNEPNFAPYYGDGIIALDACTPRSGQVNCIVVEEW